MSKFCCTFVAVMIEKREPDDSYRHVLKYTGVFGGVQGLKILVALGRNKLTANLLGKVGMGLNAVFMNVAEILNAWTNFGIPFYAVRRISELYEEGTEEETRRFVGVIRTWSLWSALLGAMLCLVLASWLDAHYCPRGERHTTEIMFLSLFVASLPIEAVECAVLKGLRRLRTLAFIEVVAALSTFFLTVPFYYFWGLRGIVASLVLCGWTVAGLHLCYTLRLVPYRVRLLSPAVLREGWPLIRIGLPYVLAAAAGTMTAGELLSYLDDGGQIGLYKAGYGLMVTYAGMIFVAVEADYFPRLSSVNHDVVRLNHTINQQIDVCVLLMAPILILLTLAMPFVVPLLWAEEFMPVVPMAVCAVFYMFFKAVTTPIAYTSLARGDSWLYLLMECIYNIVFILLMRFGYDRMGLTGAGLALSAAALFDLLLIGSVYGFYYRLRLRRRTLGLIFPQGLLLLAAVASAFLLPSLWHYLFGTAIFLLSLLFTVRKFSAELPPLLSRFRKTRRP